MRRLTAGVAASFITASLTVGIPSPAHAVDCQKWDPLLAQCKIDVVAPPLTGGTTKRVNAHSGPTAQSACVNRLYAPPGAIACTRISPRFGATSAWSNAKQCYMGALSPQPPATDVAWEGHFGQGAVYFCEPPSVRAGGNVVTYFWSLRPPAGAGAPPDPRVLARQALASMQLRAITIGMVPDNAPDRVGLVGMPVWMWVDTPGPSTWGPITRTASAGGFRVSATAKVTKVVWSMGDGSTVTCAKPGTPYQDRFGRQMSQDCGYMYAKQGHYTVSASSYWQVDWSGLGQSGTIPIDFTRSRPLTVGELQVLVQ